MVFDGPFQQNAQHAAGLHPILPPKQLTEKPIQPHPVLKPEAFSPNLQTPDAPPQAIARLVDCQQYPFAPLCWRRRISVAVLLELAAFSGRFPVDFRWRFGILALEFEIAYRLVRHVRRLQGTALWWWLRYELNLATVINCEH